MNSRSKKAGFLLGLFLLGSVILPQTVYARNIFKQIGRGLRRTIKFVVTLPDKSTRWMGPVLGPIAADMVTGGLSRSSKVGVLFNRIRKANKIIENVEEQKRYVNELKNAYHDEAVKLRDQAGELREMRHDLAESLVGGEISFDDFKQQAVAIEKLAEAYDQAADRFDHKSNTINEGTIIKLVTQNAANILLDKVKDAIVFELGTEISKFIRDDVIKNLVGGDLDKADFLIDLLVDDEWREFLELGQAEGVDTEELKDRLRDRIKDLIKESREDLSANWKDKIQEVLGELANEMKEDASSVGEVPTKKQEKVEIPVDEHGCKTGWEWNIKVGACRQTNCNDIEGAHWSYVFDCVCGSSGSINENPEDANKECAYSSTYVSCPGCVYACVHLDEDCPLDGIAGY